MAMHQRGNVFAARNSPQLKLSLSPSVLTLRLPTFLQSTDVSGAAAGANRKVFLAFEWRYIEALLLYTYIYPEGVKFFHFFLLLLLVWALIDRVSDFQ